MIATFLEQEIRRFLKSSEPEALCIRGKWGTGKTYAWTSFFKAAASEARGVAEKRYAYVSLFGVNSLSDLKTTIFENTVQGKYLNAQPSLESFGDISAGLEGLARKSAKALSAAQVPHLRSVSDLITPAMFFSVRNQIICLDDIERKGAGLTVNDILGLMSLLKEQRKCKVVLILNDEKLDERDKFERYLEKVIDKSLIFAPIAEECADIALSNSSIDRLIREFTVPLNITNIRVIRKIRMFVQAAEPSLVGRDPRVMREAVKTLTVLCWVIFTPDDAPPLAFITDRTNARISRMMSKKEFSDDERAWHALLDTIGFSNVNELEEALLSGVKNGVFDQPAIDRLAQQAEKGIRATDVRQAFEKAWRLYHDSLEDNQAELVEEIDRTFRDAAPMISVMNLNGTVILFKELGYAERAKSLIEYYCTALSSDADNRDHWHEHGFDDATDEDVATGLKAALSSRQDVRSLETVLREIAAQRWQDRNLIYVSRTQPESLVQALRSLPAEEFRGVIDTTLAFHTANASAGLPAYEKIRDAVLSLAAEHPLNARRLSRYVHEFRQADAGRTPQQSPSKDETTTAKT